MSSPRTPRHSRNPSVDLPSGASYTSAYSPQQDRRESKASSFNGSTTDFGGSNSGAGLGIETAAGGGGLGNLADELAGAFDSEGEDLDYDEDDGHYEEGGVMSDGDAQEEGEDANEAPGIRLEDTGKGDAAVRDSGVDVRSPKKDGNSLGVPAGQNGHSRGHHRRKGSEYDGSEYGSESDLESPGIPLRLVEKMDEVESLARRGTENNGSAADGTFKRVTEGLRDLGSQAGVESSATRLITAHSALTTHLTHQTRLLHNLTFPLLSPLTTFPPSIDPEAIDSLLPLLLSLPDLMPRPSPSATQSLAALHSLTADLAHALAYLSDTLHMSRQTTNAAARRLKAARDLVAELRRDEELRAEGERWLARGDWDARLARRECALVCGDVVGGFERFCDGWRERLEKLVVAAEGEGAAAKG